jgi:hypothetical protein
MQSSQVKRRRLLTLLGSAAAWARAQQVAMAVVGSFDSGFPDTFANARIGSVMVQPRLVGATSREVRYDTRRESTA